MYFWLHLVTHLCQHVLGELCSLDYRSVASVNNLNRMGSHDSLSIAREKIKSPVDI